MTHALLTLEDVSKWQERLHEIEQEQQLLTRERDDICKKLDAVQVIFGSIPKAVTSFVLPQIEAMSSESLNHVQEAATLFEPERDSWPIELLKIFEAKDGPLSYEQLKIEVDRGHLKGELSKSEKGFYHAVSRLMKRNLLTKYKGWLIRPENLATIKSEVERGLRHDLPEASTARVSPMGEAIKAFLATKPQGVGGGEVIAHLKLDERFRETLHRNATGGYNVLVRLLDRGEITKEGKVYFPLEAFSQGEV